MQITWNDLTIYTFKDSIAVSIYTQLLMHVHMVSLLWFILE